MQFIICGQDLVSHGEFIVYRLSLIAKIGDIKTGMQKEF